LAKSAFKSVSVASEVVRKLFNDDVYASRASFGFA